VKDRIPSAVDRAFSALNLDSHDSWGGAPGWNDAEPLALDTQTQPNPWRSELPHVGTYQLLN